MRWTRKGIVAEIRRLHESGTELNYATAELRHLNLVRASAWHFGTWKMAVEAAGLDYDSLSKYRRWNRDRIIERIRALKKQGKDLSWRSISTEVDPALAAAALRPNGFASWRDALAAAGIDPNEVSRYESWNGERVIAEIKALNRRSAPLSSKNAQMEHPKLFCAARRRFGSWDGALVAAGLDADKIRLRRLLPTPQDEPAPAPAQGRKTAVQAKPVAARAPVAPKAPVAAKAPVAPKAPVKSTVAKASVAKAAMAKKPVAKKSAPVPAAKAPRKAAPGKAVAGKAVASRAKK